MLSAVCIGTNDLRAAGVFYDQVLATIGMSCTVIVPDERGYAGPDGHVAVYVLRPYNKEPATFGNGSQFMFHAPDAQSVDAFYATALVHGGTSEGPPGPRHYHPQYYGAYVRDLDGNKLNVSTYLPDPQSDQPT